MTEPRLAMPVSAACLAAMISLLIGLWSASLQAREASDNYRDYCALCHGLDGERGVWRGRPIIGESSIRLTDEALYRVIEQGRPDKGMPSFALALSQAEIAALVVHVGKLQGLERSAPEVTLTPSAELSVEQIETHAEGRSLFEQKCMACHSIMNEGGRMAPDLTEVEKRLSREELYTAIRDPYADIVRGFEVREVVTNEGDTLLGWARPEFTPKGSFQLYNPEEALWTTYFKRDLRSQRQLPVSLMPTGLLDDLSEDEIKALLSYLLSTKPAFGR